MAWLTRHALRIRRGYQSWASSRQINLSNIPAVNLKIISQEELQTAVEAMKQKVAEEEREKIKQKRLEIDWYQDKMVLGFGFGAVLIVWAYGVISERTCIHGVNSLMANVNTELAGAEYTIRAAKHTWNNKMLVIEDELRVLEKERSQQVKTLEGLTDALRSSCLAVGKWYGGGPVETSSTKPYPSGVYNVVRQGGVKVREDQDSSSAVITSIPAGTRVHIIKTAGRKAYISYPYDGWITFATRDGRCLVDDLK